MVSRPESIFNARLPQQKSILMVLKRLLVFTWQAEQSAAETENGASGESGDVRARNSTSQNAGMAQEIR